MQRDGQKLMIRPSVSKVFRTFLILRRSFNACRHATGGQSLMPHLSRGSCDTMDSPRSLMIQDFPGVLVERGDGSERNRELYRVSFLCLDFFTALVPSPCVP